MISAQTSTIVQLLFEQMPTRTFPALVRELDEALSESGRQPHLAWDSDEMVFVDLDGTRVGLGYSEGPVQGHAACLTVTVGPSPAIDAAVPSRKLEQICRRIVAQVCDRLGADSVLWHNVHEPVTADLVDRLLEQLPFPEVSAAPVPDPTGVAATDSATLPAPVPAPSAARDAGMPGFAEAAPAFQTAAPADRAVPTPLVRHHPGSTGEAAREKARQMAARIAASPEATATIIIGKRAHCGELQHLRQALYADAQEAISEAGVTRAQRMAAHAMNLTLAIALPPVGTTLLAASFRNGVDLKTSARAMAFTGGLFAMAQSAAAGDLVFLLPL